nr:hypothetical protein StreXyl84_05250 [Streptomyces sp. Xyl84]
MVHPDDVPRFARLGATASIQPLQAAPVSSPDPLRGIHVAVNRHEPARRAPVFLPAERIGLAEAVRACTAGPARVNHLDDTGEVRTGALADLVVLDRDPFAGPPEEIADTKVRETYVGGVRVSAAE